MKRKNNSRDRDPAPRAGLGASLRAARQRLGWELPEVAAWLRIRLDYLEALEEDRPEALPATAYALGYLRSYARALGLDPDDTARRFRAELAGQAQDPELSFPAPVPERGVPMGAVALIGLVLAAGAYAAWYRVSGDGNRVADAVAPVPQHLAQLAGPEKPAMPPSPQVASVMPPPGEARLPPAPAMPPSAASPSAAPATPVAVAAGQPSPPSEPPPAVPATSPISAAAATPPPAVPPGESRILLRATADSWLQVREKQGPVLLSRVLRAGETWPVPADKPQLVLTTGNAGGTELVVDGVATAPLGASGMVRRDVPLDPDLLKSGKLSQPGNATTRANGQ